MGKNDVITFSRLFLIGSFSHLQVTRTYIKAYMSLNFGQIPPLTTELAALERLKNRCHHVISVDINPIFFKLAGNKDMHNIMNEFEFRPDLTTDYGVSCPWASKKYPYRLVMYHTGRMTVCRYCQHWWKSRNIRILHGYEVQIENSVPRVTVASRGFAEWCETVIPRDGIFYLHQTLMFDSFSCIPLDFEWFILKIAFINHIQWRWCRKYF